MWYMQMQSYTRDLNIHEICLKRLKAILCGYQGLNAYSMSWDSRSFLVLTIKQKIFPWDSCKQWLEQRIILFAVCICVAIMAVSAFTISGWPTKLNANHISVFNNNYNNKNQFSMSISHFRGAFIEEWHWGKLSSLSI